MMVEHVNDGFEYGITLVLVDDSVDRDRLLKLMIGEALPIHGIRMYQVFIAQNAC